MMITDDIGKALQIASQLDAINKERRNIQSEATDIALNMIYNLEIYDRKSLVVFDPSFHEGVVSLVSSKMKEQYSLPSAALTLAEDGSV